MVKAESTGGSKKITLPSPSNPLAERNQRTLVEGGKRFPKRDSIGILVRFFIESEQWSSAPQELKVDN